MNHSDYVKDIIDYLNRLLANISDSGKANLNDDKISAEYFFSDFINKLYGLKLENANNIKNNYPGIDLIDNENKIIYQVTSKVTSEKIEHSFDGICEKKEVNYDESGEVRIRYSSPRYERGDLLANFQGYTMRMMFIAKSPSGLRNKTFNTPSGIEFNPKTDIWGIDTLIKRVEQESSIDILKELKEIAVKHIDSSFRDFAMLQMYNFYFEKLQKSAITSEKPDFDINKATKAFEASLGKKYHEYSHMHSFALASNQCLLKQYYLPLTMEIREESHKITGYPRNILEKYRYLLIQDYAGMGKSTLVKRMFLDIVDRGYGFPILIELRHLNSKHLVLDEICGILSHFRKQESKDDILQFIEEGNFIFIFDGFDEIPYESKTTVTENLQEFITKAGRNNRYILTSRPEDELSRFTSFQTAKIRKLKKEEAFSILKSFDDGTQSLKLVEKLKEVGNKSVLEFLETPLLVSLLYATFDFANRIPLNKGEFYDEVYNALFHKHDAKKGDADIHPKKSGLDLSSMATILRYIAFVGKRKGEVEYSHRNLTKLIEEAKNETSISNFNTENFLSDVTKAVPMFIQEGKYRWAHKSLQEYFAAEYVCQDTPYKKEILEKACSNEKIDKFENFLDIYYSIDQIWFNKVVTKQLLEDYFEFCEERGITENSTLEEKKACSLLYSSYIMCFGEEWLYKYYDEDSDAEDPFDLLKNKALETTDNIKLTHWNTKRNFGITDAEQYFLLQLPNFKYIIIRILKDTELILKNKEEYINGFISKNLSDREFIIIDDWKNISIDLFIKLYEQSTLLSLYINYDVARKEYAKYISNSNSSNKDLDF